MCKISVLLAHYDEDGSLQKYLDVCLKSLNQQKFQDFETIIISSGEFKPDTSMRMFNTQHYHSTSRLHFPQAIEKAYSLVGSETEMIMLLNNDTSLDEACIETMYNTIKAVPNIEMILNALCNSDAFGFLYYARTGLSIGEMFGQPQYTFEQTKDQLDQLTKLHKYPFALIPVGFNPFYATMLKKSTYDKVGGINPKYLTNLDDLDFAVRARKLGIKSMVAMHAAVFHFGGATTNKTKTADEENFNRELFKSYHGFMP
jgi:GT2 family glycosyltransferase